MHQKTERQFRDKKVIKRHNCICLSLWSLQRPLFVFYQLIAISLLIIRKKRVKDFGLILPIINSLLLIFLTCFLYHDQTTNFFFSQSYQLLVFCKVDIRPDTGYLDKYPAGYRLSGHISGRNPKIKFIPSVL